MDAIERTRELAREMHEKAANTRGTAFYAPFVQLANLYAAHVQRLIAERDRVADNGVCYEKYSAEQLGRCLAQFTHEDRQRYPERYARIRLLCWQKDLAAIIDANAAGCDE